LWDKKRDKVVIVLSPVRVVIVFSPLYPPVIPKTNIAQGEIKATRRCTLIEIVISLTLASLSGPLLPYWP
jgi:hypothetical protein